MKKADIEEIRKNPINNCKCGGCTDVELPWNEFKIHLKEVHQIDPATAKGQKQMILHMGHGWGHSYTYQWTLEAGLSFTQFITRAKSKR